MDYEHGKCYIIEAEKNWRVKRNFEGVQVEYKVSKKLAESLEDLKKYITDQPDIF